MQVAVQDNANVRLDRLEQSMANLSQQHAAIMENSQAIKSLIDQAIANGEHTQCLGCEYGRPVRPASETPDCK